MISLGFETPPGVTERGQYTGYSIIPNSTNQTIAFVFDFQVKKDSEDGLIAFGPSLGELLYFT